MGPGASPPPPASGHPVFAALYDALTKGAENHFVQPLRRRLLAGCHGDVLDLGAGTGADFPVLQSIAASDPTLRVEAVEPDPHMRRRAQARAEAMGLPVQFHAAPAEDLPMADGSFDYVVATLVLCTVTDVAKGLHEVHRVLRPGGELRFLEHVRSEGPESRWQDRLRPLWARLAAGCQLNRRTGDLLRASAFEAVRWEEVRLPFPVYRLLMGSARKAVE